MSNQPDPWSSLAMLTNDHIQRAIDERLPCCLGGLADSKCCDCPELAAKLRQSQSEGEG